MVNSKAVFCFVLTLILGYTSLGQVNRYMVFFNDKANSPYQIEEPISYLSQRAINRRVNQNIAITEEDLPVNPAYVAGIRELEIETYYTSKWMNGVLIQADGSRLPDIQALEYVSRIEYVAPGERLTPEIELDPGPLASEPVDRGSLTNLAEREMLGGDVMNEAGYSGDDIWIAFSDGGFSNVNSATYFEYLFTTGQYLGGVDFVTNGHNPFQYSLHGTGVLSTVVGDAGMDFRGIAPESSVVLLVTEDVDSEYRIEEYNWLFGAEYADSLGVDILNVSLGYTDFDDNSMNYTQADLDGATTIITRAAELAFSKGMLIVTSVGNNGDRAWRLVSAPADGPNVLAVGAVNNERSRIALSSVGPTADGRIKPDVMAKGSGVAQFRTTFTSRSGTSFAAPLIAGLAAGLWQANPDWTNEQLLQGIKRRGSRFEFPDNNFGHGIPHFELNRVLAIKPNKLEWSVYPNPTSEGKFTLETQNANLLEVQIYNDQGQSVPVTTRMQDDRKLQLDLSDKASGIYFIKLQTQHGTETIRVLNYPN